VSPNIVVGIDGSNHSIHALEWAVKEAEIRQAEITALFAWQMPMIGIPGAFDRDELEAEAQKFLNGEVAKVETDGVAVNPVTAQGDPSASLIEACKRLEADMLVLGARGRDGFGGLLLGSVGQECASHATCPVLIYNDDETGTKGSKNG
jgi:nucleotide-binding universal stress UspA family protein